MDITKQEYRPPGPVGAAFIKSHGPIDIIMGPAGSGKTVASVIKGPMLAASYMPVCRDGVVRVKLVCVRDTYRDFARTALASWHETFPIGHPWQRADKGYEGGQDRPVRHHLEWEAKRGGDRIKIEFTLETGAIADQNVMQFVRGYEVSMAWGNEVDLMDPIIPSALFMRTGRYPPMKDIAPSELERVSKDGREALRKMGVTVTDSEPVLPRMFWGDMNPPDIDHPILADCGYVDLEKKKPAFNFFHQPGGLDAQAENRAGRPRSAYEMDLLTMPEHLARRMVHGLPGYSRDGTPVYQNAFNIQRHRADQPITPQRDLGLTIGIDAGGSPAATIGQFTPFGQNRLLAEVVAEPGTGPTRFGQLLLSTLMTRFAGFRVVGAWADPSAWNGADKQTDEFHWVNTLQAIVGFPILPAPSNEPSIRQEAVKHYLGLTIDGKMPAYLVDPSCKMMIGGFEAHYKLSKKNSTYETDKLAVIKNEYSHPHDAEQYRCLGFLGLAALMNRAVDAVLPGNVTSLQSRRDRNKQQPAQRDRMDFNI